MIRPEAMIHKALFAATAAALCIGAAPPQAAALQPSEQRTGNPLSMVEVTPAKTHILGSPEAKQTLVEYLSYTCGQCAVFEINGADTIKYGAVGSGKLRLEIRHYIFNEADLTVATALHCLPKENFFLAHTTMLRTQAQWAPKWRNATPAQRIRYETGTPKQIMQAIARDIGLYQSMEQFGLSNIELDRCLGDPAIYKPILQQTDDAAKVGVNSTPSFLLGGTKIPQFTWPEVGLVLDRALTAQD